MANTFVALNLRRKNAADANMLKETRMKTRVQDLPYIWTWGD